MIKKTMMLFVCLVAAAILWALPAQAACDNSTINGSYGFHAHGFGANGMPEAPVPAGGSLPGAIQGDITFDGNGNITHGTQKVSAGGTQITISGITGTYNVNPDCSGTVTRVFPQGFRIRWAIEVVNGGAEILFLYLEPGVTIEGTIVKR
jgi:hypothetical protein